MTKKEEFRKKGYIVIKNAFDIDEIKSLRESCYKPFYEKKLISLYDGREYMRLIAQKKIA